MFSQSRNLKVEEASRLRGSKDIIFSYYSLFFINGIIASVLHFALSPDITEMVLCWFPKFFILFHGTQYFVVQELP